MGGNITLIDETYNYLLNSKEKKSFSEIWNHLCNDTNLVDEEKKNDATYKSKFYTALTLDSRFVFLSGNTWDLRDRQTFDVVKNIMNLEMAYQILMLIQMKIKTMTRTIIVLVKLLIYNLRLVFIIL